MSQHEILIECDQNDSPVKQKNNTDVKHSKTRWLFFRRNQTPELNNSCSDDVSNISSPDAINSSEVDLVNSENPENHSDCSFCGFGTMIRYLKRTLFQSNPSSKKAKRSKLNDQTSIPKNENVPNQTSPQVRKSPKQAHNHQVLRQDWSIVPSSIINPEPNVDQTVDKTQNESQPNQMKKDGSKNRKRKAKRRAKNNQIKNALPPPKEIIENLDLKKYWIKRYRLFSKYDEGIQLDKESWYSVTPEKIAQKIAERCRCDVIIDGFCGAGGNSIQFAITCERVIAIDIDEEKIKMAKHNAEIYGVADRIEFIVGDFFEVVPSLKADVIFLSPPWGGPEYSKAYDFPLNGVFEPYGGKHLYDVAKQVTNEIAYYLPRNINIDEVAKLVNPVDEYVKIDRHYLDAKMVAITAYFGELVEDYVD